MVKAAATLEVQIISNLARLKSDMDRMDRLVAEATGSASRNFGNAGKAASMLAADVQQMAARTRGSMQGLGTSAAQQKAGMQQLGFQIQDLGVQMAMAAGSGNVMKGVMTGLAMQGPQIVSAIAMMRKEAGGLIGFLNGPWGAAFMAATSVVAILAPKLFETSDAMKQVEFASSAVGDAQSILGGVLDLTTGKVRTQSAALIGLAQAQLAVARVEAQARQAAARTAVQSMQERKMQWSGGFGGGFFNYDAQPGAAKVISREVLSGQLSSKDAVQRLDNLRKVGVLTQEAFTQAAKAVANLGVEAENLKVFDSAQRVLDGVGTAVDRNLLLKPERARKTIAKVNDELQKMAEWLKDTRTEANGDVWKLAEEMARRQLDLKLEEKTVGEQIKQQDDERFRLRQTEIEAEQQMLDLYLQQLAVLQQMGGVARVAGGVLAGLATGNFSGLDGKIGRLLQGVGMTVGTDGWKKVTDKLDSIFGTAGDGSFARIMRDTFAAGGIGSLAGGMALGSGNSGLGSFAGGAIGEKLGEKFLSKGLESIASGLGQFAGPLGAIAGGILGGALGGLLKKAKWGTSVVTGQGAGNVATAGNKAAYRSNAGLAGTSIQSGLDAIAAEFGAAVGAYDVSIGQYKGKWRVSSTGRAGKLKGKYSDVTDFGKDGAEDAIKFAIADAIKDGALIGLRASTQALLSASDDVEGQLKKALQFEGVFSELKSLTDPVGYAIEELDKQFAQLRDVFAEAGATSGEYAQLEQLYQRKRVDAIKEANAEADELSRNRRSLEARMLELQGRTVESVAMMRQIEVEQMQESLRPLQRRVWAMEDATAIIEQMQPYIDSLKAYRATLLGGGDTGMTYRAALVKLMGTGGLAAAGDATALGALQGAGQDFLTAAKDNARNLTQYQRDVALVARYVDGGIGAAQTQVDYAKRTLEAQDASVALLTSIDQSLTTAVGVGAITPGLIEPIVSGAQVATLVDEVKAMRAEAHAQARSIAESAAHMDRLMTRWDGDGLLVRGEADTPVYVADAP